MIPVDLRASSPVGEERPGSDEWPPCAHTPNPEIARLGEFLQPRYTQDGVN